jgi:hypothetical protein
VNNQEPLRYRRNAFTNTQPPVVNHDLVGSKCLASALNRADTLLPKVMKLFWVKDIRYLR